MWDNSLWEQEHQEELMQDYLYQHLNGGAYYFKYPVRRIICEGCGQPFYTQVKVKKYCNTECAKKGFWKHKRERRLAQRKDMICKICGSSFTPKPPMPCTAAMLVGRKRIARTLRLMVMDQNDPFAATSTQ